MLLGFELFGKVSIYDHIRTFRSSHNVLIFVFPEIIYQTPPSVT